MAFAQPKEYNRMHHTPRKTKASWWVPKDDDQKELFESSKSDIKTFLTITKDGVEAHRSYEILAENLDGGIQYKEMGFASFGEFLFHCDDVVSLKKDTQNKYYLFLRGEVGEDNAHMRDLVQNQKATKKPYTKKFFAPIDDLLQIEFRIPRENPKRKSPQSPIEKDISTLSIESKPPPPERNSERASGMGRMNSHHKKRPHQSNSRGSFQNQQGERRTNETKNSGFSRGLYSRERRQGRGRIQHREKYRRQEESNQSNLMDKSSSDDEGDMVLNSGTVLDLATFNSRYQVGTKQHFPNESTFTAKFMGCDEYGIVYLQVNDRELNASFDELKRSLRNFYSSPSAKEEYRIKPFELQVGLLVIAFVECAMVRAKIFEIHYDSEGSGFCVFQYFDYGHFDVCNFENIFRVVEIFKSHPPRIMKCVLAGMDEIMCTDEIGQLLSEIPLQPELEVNVLSRSHHTFNIPVVHLTTSTGEFLSDLLQSVHSNNYWPSFDTKIYLTAPQRSILKFLQDRSYFC